MPYTLYDGSSESKAAFFMACLHNLLDTVQGARAYVIHGITAHLRTNRLYFYSMKHIQDYLSMSIPLGSLDAPVNHRAMYLNAPADTASFIDELTPLTCEPGGAATHKQHVVRAPRNVSELGPRAASLHVSPDKCNLRAAAVAQHFLSRITHEETREH